MVDETTRVVGFTTKALLMPANGGLLLPPSVAEEENEPPPQQQRAWPCRGGRGCWSSGKLRHVVGNSLQTVDRVMAARHHPRVQHKNSDLCCAWPSSTRPRPWLRAGGSGWTDYSTIFMARGMMVGELWKKNEMSLAGNSFCARSETTLGNYLNKKLKFSKNLPDGLTLNSSS